MSKEVIHEGGEDIVVREDTAKAYRWRWFAVVLFGGIILIFAAWILFFSGWVLIRQPNLGPGTAQNSNLNQNTGP